MSDVDRAPEEGPGAAIVNLVARTLREPVVVRAEWRNRVLREVDAAAATGSRRRGRAARSWNITPSVALAAAIGCMMIGAAAALLIPGRGHLTWIVGAGRVDAAAISLDGAPRVRPEPLDVRFALVAPYAAEVSLVGDFNRWNPRALPMRRIADGRTWVLDVPLPPGRHVYAFVVDGDLTPDPAAPHAGEDDFGVQNSVVLVSERTP